LHFHLFDNDRKDLFLHVHHHENDSSDSDDYYDYYNNYDFKNQHQINKLDRIEPINEDTFNLSNNIRKNDTKVPAILKKIAPKEPLPMLLPSSTLKASKKNSKEIHIDKDDDENLHLHLHVHEEERYNDNYLKAQ
jgi:hypothetical protein